MNAQEILDEIRMLGGRLEAREDRLHVEVPAGVLDAEYRERLAAFKPELLALLQRKRRDAELDASRQRLESAGISIAVWEDGQMHVLVSDSVPFCAVNDGGTIYSPADMYHYVVTLTESERRLFHNFKRTFRRSTTEWRSGVTEPAARFDHPAPINDRISRRDSRARPNAISRR